MPDRRFTTLLAQIANDASDEWTALVCRESRAYIEQLEAALREIDNEATGRLVPCATSLAIIKGIARRALAGEDTDG